MKISKTIFFLFGLMCTGMPVFAQQLDSAYLEHTVAPKENLYRISLKYKVTVPQLMGWNGLSNYNIEAGQQLKVWMKIPNSDGNTVISSTQPAPTQAVPVVVAKPIAAAPAIVEYQRPDSSTAVQRALNKAHTLPLMATPNTDLSMTGTILSEVGENYSPLGKITIGGYISSYYAYYTDSVDHDKYTQFPTSAARNNQFGLNIAQFTFKYNSSNFRGIATLHFGDIPNSAWSPVYNMIQEANAGFRIFKKVWFDAGFFRTHIGLESIQPRENITMSIALTTYFEPYYLSGAKVTWEVSDKFSIQANAFNSFNGFVAQNTRKAGGLTALWQPNSSFSIGLTSMYSDEAADTNTSKGRLYNELLIIYRAPRVDLGFEANYGVQNHSSLADPLKHAEMYSGIAVAKFKFTRKFATYVRDEFYHDPDAILCPIYTNQDLKAAGLEVEGVTLGMEIKPIPNSYIRFEGRWLETLNHTEIFNYQHAHTSHRYEGIIGTGIWF